MNSGEGKMTVSRPLINKSSCAIYLCHIIMIGTLFAIVTSSVSNFLMSFWVKGWVMVNSIVGSGNSEIQLVMLKTLFGLILAKILLK